MAEEVQKKEVTENRKEKLSEQVKKFGEQQEKLNIWQNQLNGQQKAIDEENKNIAKKENNLVEREKKLDAREENLNQRETEIVKRENLADKDFTEKRAAQALALENQNKASVENFSKKINELLTSTSDNNSKLTEEFIKSIDARANEALKKQQQVLDSYTRQIEKLSEEIEAQRQKKTEALEREMISYREKRIGQIDSEIQQRQKLVETQEKDLRGREMALAEDKGRYEKELQIFQTDKTKADGIIAAQEELNDRIRNFDSEVNQKVVEAIKDKISFYDNQVEDLKNQLQISLKAQQLMEHYEIMVEQWGDDPNILQEKMEDLLEKLQKSQQDFDNRHAELIEENKRLAKLVEDIERREAIVKENESKMSAMEKEMANLRSLNDVILEKDQQIKDLNKQINRLTGYNNDPEARQDRINDITIPQFNFLPDQKHWDEVKTTNEMEWLEGIKQGCQSHGLIFPERIINSFHTSHKCSDITLLTVLAGISGSGKSELPKFYSHFGGMKFLNVAVEPNWDSLESMIGYFNALDGKFNAKEILRFLTQTQSTAEGNLKKPTDLDKYMNMILLDEMNLANVELYFADFLSKLEDRRSRGENNLPFIDINLGVKPDYRLTLGRNVLWTGTMNEDETTKSLSDKVLDRGNIIHFPSPEKLIGRKEFKPLEEDYPLLKKATWDTWKVSRNYFANEEKLITPYTELINNINAELKKCNRGYANRLFQSIQIYMANYPEVLAAGNDENKKKEALKKAFEDQLVQKIMPKLRGMESASEVDDSALEKIRGLLSNGDLLHNPEGLLKDFDNARKNNYGTFAWCTSEYLKDN